MSKLLSSLPVGALVKDTGTTYNGENPIFRVLEHGHTGDPTGTTTLEFRDIISLKCFDAKEPNNSDSNRKSYGNNRYLHSNLLQWLNSDAAANAWYSAQHNADQKPDSSNVWAQSGTPINPYDTEKGFLANFSSELKAALQTVTKVTAKNTVTDGGGYESVSSKIFLLSTTEVGLANENSVAEGSIYAYYSADNQNSRRVKKVANTAAIGNYSNASCTAGAAWLCWLRTPFSGYSCYARYVSTDGSLNRDGAYYGYGGVSPAFSLLSSVTVSDTADANGVYTLEWNAAPTISPATQAFGDVVSAPTLSLSIADADGDAITGVVKLDGVQKDTFSATGAKTYSVPFSTWWNDVSLGTHTVTVDVTDANGASATGTYTFNRTNSAPVITPASKSIGSISQPASVQFSVTDADGDRFSLSVKIDNNEVVSLSNQSNQTYTLDLADYWSGISVAAHTITITATDAHSAAQTATYTFTRTNSAPTVTPDSQDYGSLLSPPSIDLIITDPEGDAYTASVRLDNVEKATFSGTGSGTHTIPIASWWGSLTKDAQHTIQASVTDSNGAVTTKTYTVTPAKSQVAISGADANLGNVWIAPELVYQVSDTGATVCNVVEKIDGVVTKTINNISLYTNYTFDLSGFGNLTSEHSHTFTVEATNADGNTATRTWTITKLWGELAFYTNAVPTDAAAKKINVVLDYSKTGNPTVMVEVTNNACAIQATWEDATEDVMAGKAYEFENDPADDFGIAVRVTITKSASTERVYVYSLGVSFS